MRKLFVMMVLFLAASGAQAADYFGASVGFDSNAGATGGVAYLHSFTPGVAVAVNVGSTGTSAAVEGRTPIGANTYLFGNLGLALGHGGNMGQIIAGGVHTEKDGIFARAAMVRNWAGGPMPSTALVVTVGRVW